MIIFKKLRYRNFKSVGNHPIEIDFTATKTTLISGKNGHGKSTVTSALCFALFGQDFVLTKGGIINSINLKQLEVELEFEANGIEYRIVRGIKPNVFQIFQGGSDKPLNEDAATRDYQKVLETQILKMDIRAFKQVIVVGGRNYTPFMKLKAGDRREFIEDLLDIRIFSTMGTLLKEQQKSTKEELRILEGELKSTKEKVELQKTFIDTLSADKDAAVGRIESAIQSLIEENEKFNVALAPALTKEKRLLDRAADYDGVSDTLSALRQEQRTLVSNKEKHEKAISFYSTTTVCPTCTQEIDSEHKEHILNEKGGEIESCSNEIEGIAVRLDDARVKLEEYEALQEEIYELQEKIRRVQAKVSSNNQLIKKYRAEIEGMGTDSESIEAEKAKLKKMAKVYIERSEKKKELLELQQYQDFQQQILADGGIKAKIIKQYIPTINKLINKYLGEMDFFVSFHLDENFNETIKSRHRDTFKYENFSDGQQARIDVALAFAWRDIAQMRNAVNTNLLFMDEIDKEMDAEGAALLGEMIHKFEKTNVVVISHKGDVLRDKFDRAIHFVLKNNFTEMVDNQ